MNKRFEKMIFSQFGAYPNIKYGFSDRPDGSMNRFLEKENRETYFNSIGVDPQNVVTADLAHSSGVARVSREHGGTMVPKKDGLVTNEKNLLLSGTAADCFLLYFYSSEKEAVGIAHVGWRGLLAGVVENTVGALKENFGVVPQNTLVGISPGIRKCHFEISRGDAEKFDEYPKFISDADGKVFVDLPGIIRSKLDGKGILTRHIEDSGVCTYCSENEYFSYRRDKPENPEVQIGYIGLI